MKAKKRFFGLRELIAIGVGGMIGGGVFSVLGIAVDISGHAAPLAFLIAGVVALVAGYSYVKLALAFYSDGASFTYLEYAYPHLPNLAGILGWIVVVGYIGTLALYAFTFGVYAADLFGLPDSFILRTLLSVFVLTFFMVINLLGVRETGLSEDLIVYSKILLLIVLGVIGFFSVQTSYYVPLFNKGPFSIFIGAAIIFVAYEGFQLITNTVCETENPRVNIPKSIYVSIAVVTVVYFLLATMSVGNLTLEEFGNHGEYALAIAVSSSFGKLGRVLVDISAILAASSAINATLLGSSRMAREIAKERMMPKAFSFQNKGKVPWIALVTITLISMMFALSVDLETIAIFASLTFLFISIAVALANIKLRKKTNSNVWISILGAIFMLVVLGMLVWHLILYQFKVFLLVCCVYVIVGVLELLVSQRRIKAGFSSRFKILVKETKNDHLQ